VSTVKITRINRGFLIEVCTIDIGIKSYVYFDSAKVRQKRKVQLVGFQQYFVQSRQNGVGGVQGVVFSVCGKKVVSLRKILRRLGMKLIECVRGLLANQVAAVVADEYKIADKALNIAKENLKKITK
jgi:hypothetical protein